MQKWMIFLRETDGVYFVWNGEFPISFSPGYKESRLWSSNTCTEGTITDQEIDMLNTAMKGRFRRFTIPGHGYYQVVSRGEFKEL